MGFKSDVRTMATLPAAGFDMQIPNSIRSEWAVVAALLAW